MNHIEELTISHMCLYELRYFKGETQFHVQPIGIDLSDHFIWDTKDDVIEFLSLSQILSKDCLEELKVELLKVLKEEQGNTF